MTDSTFLTLAAATIQLPTPGDRPHSPEHPAGRFGHSLIWTGDRLIVWGGAVGFGGDVNTGALYDPRTDTWTAISTTNAPSPRLFFASGWDATNLFIWGGAGGLNNARSISLPF